MATEDLREEAAQEEPEAPASGEDQAQDPSDPGEEKKSFTLSTEGERAAMIASVLRDQAIREGMRALTPGPSPKPLFPQLVALAVATLLAAYVWFGSPGWLGPHPVPLPPVEVEAATLRLEMFIQAQAIEHYREQNGRTPAFLQEVGPPRPGITYRRLDASTYLLQGHGERVRLSLSSRDSLATFLGADGEALLLGPEAQ